MKLFGEKFWLFLILKWTILSHVSGNFSATNDRTLKTNTDN